MEKYFCDYEQSLALKELGFRERTLFYFEENVSKMHNSETGWDFNSSFKTCTSRPLKAQVFEWARNGYKIQSLIQEYMLNTYMYTIDDGINSDISVVGFETYEEAESACIDELIKIIKDER